MTEPVRAGIYCRLSRALDGSTEKVEDQERRCRETAAMLGWDVAEVYSDNSLSAWKRSVRRPAWETMLSDIEAGKINGVIAYHGDRLVRQPRDLEKLIDLAEGKGIRVASPTGTRDLDNRDDRAMARVIAAFAENEAAATSDRRKAQYARWRQDGKVRTGGRGGRAFGFGTDGITHVPIEADVIREAAAAILAGQSVSSVATGLRDRGVVTTADHPMSHNTLRRVLVNPRTAGLMPDGIHPAAWEPVLDRDTWEMTRAVLLANQASPRAGAGALHLLSAIATCGECTHPLWAGRNAGGLAYRCPQCGRVVRNAALLDAYVTGAVVTRLNHPDNPQPRIELHSGVAAELASLSARRAETEAFIASLADAPMSRIEVLNRALDSFDTRIAAIREQLAGDTTGRLLAAHAGITRKEFENLPLDVRRSLVRATYRVVVLRASRRGGPGFRAEDVVLDPVKGGKA